MSDDDEVLCITFRACQQIIRRAGGCIGPKGDLAGRIGRGAVTGHGTETAFKIIIVSGNGFVMDDGDAKAAADDLFGGQIAVKDRLAEGQGNKIRNIAAQLGLDDLDGETVASVRAFKGKCDLLINCAVCKEGIVALRDLGGDGNGCGHTSVDIVLQGLQHLRPECFPFGGGGYAWKRRNRS